MGFNGIELTRISEELVKLREATTDTDLFKRASDYEIVIALIECAIIKTKERLGVRNG